MGKIDWNGIVRNVRQTLRKRSPEIWMGLGIGGFFGMSALAVWATPEAMRRIRRREKELDRKLTTLEAIQTAGVCYIPAVFVGGVSTACVICSGKISSKRNAALATAYALSETTLREYRDKVVDKIGEKKEQEIQDEIDRDHVEQNPPQKNEIAFMEGSGLTLCYDAEFGRYFHSTIENLRRAENKLNRQMSTMCEPYISLNEFIQEVDAPDFPTIQVGDRVGWNLERGLIELRFSSQLAGGRVPCLVMNYAVAPDYNYIL